MKHGWLVLLCLLGWGVNAQAGTHVVVDDAGRKVQLTASPQRIVSLLPSLTEMVCRLGKCGLIVGVDRYSTWPVEVRNLPVVGGGLDPNIEAIVALKPDVVLAGTSMRAADRLAGLGIHVVALEPQTHADVRRVLDKVGEVIGVTDAQQVWSEIDAALQAAAASLPARVAQTRVFFEVNRGPYGASESSFIGETLSRLGAQNILPAKMGPFPKLNPEFVVRANPDVIMIGDSNAEGLAQRPGWQNIRAIREERVCIFSPKESEILVRPGPRMAEAAWLMARCLDKQAPVIRGQK